MNKRSVYAIINFIFCIIAAFYLLQEITTTKVLSRTFNLQMLLVLLAVTIGFFTVHFLKMLRLYFVLIEQKIGIFRFIKVYFKTTFVNIMIPFKIGELFRIYCFSHETKVMQIGVLCVVIDRYFDTVGLLLLVMPLEIILNGRISLLSGILLAFILIILFIYIVFMPTYLYLNKYLIMNATTNRAIVFLHALEQIKSWYDYSKQLIKGRYAIILFLSLLGWVTEEGVLFGISYLIGKKFTFTGFLDYLQAIFAQSTSWLLSYYSLFSACLLAAMTVILYTISFIGKRGTKNA